MSQSRLSNMILIDYNTGEVLHDPTDLTYPSQLDFILKECVWKIEEYDNGSDTAYIVYHKKDHEDRR